MSTVMRQGVTDTPGAAFVDVVFHDGNGSSTLSEVWKWTKEGMVLLYVNRETLDRHLVYDRNGNVPGPLPGEVQA